MTLPEYTYVALTEIWHGGVRAYNPGDPVPAANVEAQKYEVGVQVARRDTKTADKATDQAAESTGAQPAQQPPAQGPAAAEAPKKTAGGKASS
jgi:hypothetical protein